ncbi:hypothetical protein ACTJJ7_24640 [Phyllobacterium sp. 22229]|uniref:hypothetical protein n=1 Tax=Phyllobacterium sp. 22229 TaxID=3453895 RepID=UPI003F841E45
MNDETMGLYCEKTGGPEEDQCCDKKDEPGNPGAAHIDVLTTLAYRSSGDGGLEA